VYRTGAPTLEPLTLQIDFQAREITVKLVYYGPALSGKTTNLQALHAVAQEGTAGRLLTLETRDDRTLFFDLLPLTFKAKGDVSIRLKVFTVPGQVIHASTRRLVVQGADGVVFVADSQVEETRNNGASFLDLKNNLKAHGVQLKDMPVVIQFNKRDLPNVRTREELADLAKKGKEPVYLAVAMRGEGVVETFLGALQLAWQKLEKEHRLGEKFGIEGPQLLAQVSERLGRPGDAELAVAARVGGVPVTGAA
jgi:mutual gliding-motility protein MglA